MQNESVQNNLKMKQKLKKIKFLLTLSLLGLLLFSCNKDEDNSVLDSNGIFHKQYSDILKEEKFANAVSKLTKNSTQNSASAKSYSSSQNVTTLENQFGFTIANQEVNVAINDTLTSYTMLINRAVEIPNEFENLIILIDNNSNTTAFILKYSDNVPVSYTNLQNQSSQKQILSTNYVLCVEYQIWTCNYPGHTETGTCNYGHWESITVCSSSGGGGGNGGTGGTGGTGGSSGGSGSGGTGSSSPSTNVTLIPTATVTPTVEQAIHSFVLSLSPQQQLWWNNPANTDLVNQIKAFLAKKFPNITLEDFEFANQLVSDYMNNIINPIASNIPLINISLANQITDIIDYLKCFDPTQPAVFTLYVDQPTANSNTPWSGNPLSPDVGHTFISIKQGTIRRVLGFYPSSSVDLNNPSVTGVCENNSNHTFDVSLSLNITTTQLKNILSYIKFKSASTYNLNTANCTDFGMGAIKLAGIDIPSAYGTWGAPGVGSGAGDNPGQLGQNIRNMPVANNVVKTTSTGNAQSNMGTCP